MLPRLKWYLWAISSNNVYTDLFSQINTEKYSSYHKTGILEYKNTLPPSMFYSTNITLAFYIAQYTNWLPQVSHYYVINSKSGQNCTTQHCMLSYFQNSFRIAFTCYPATGTVEDEKRQFMGQNFWCSSLSRQHKECTGLIFVLNYYKRGSVYYKRGSVYN